MIMSLKTHVSRCGRLMAVETAGRKQYVEQATSQSRTLTHAPMCVLNQSRKLANKLINSAAKQVSNCAHKKNLQKKKKKKKQRNNRNTKQINCHRMLMYRRHHFEIRELNWR